MDKLTVSEKVRGIAEKAVENTALELVHVEMVGSKKNPIIRIYIDKEEGITHADCQAISVEVDNVIENQELIADAFTLEVSSPGIERGLYKIEDFERFANDRAKIKTHSSVGNQKNFLGTIIGVEDDEVIFDDKTNGIVEIPYSIIKKANLEFDLNKELKQAKRKP